MARKKSPTLTEAELRLMDVIWEKGEATVAEVAEALPSDVGLAYNTVLTTMRIRVDCASRPELAIDNDACKGSSIQFTSLRARQQHAVERPHDRRIHRIVATDVAPLDHLLLETDRVAGMDHIPAVLLGSLSRVAL